MANPTNNLTGVGQGPSGDAKIKKQGHTASVFGSDPSLNAMGQADQEPRDLKA